MLYPFSTYIKPCTTEEKVGLPLRHRIGLAIDIALITIVISGGVLAILQMNGVIDLNALQNRIAFLGSFGKYGGLVACGTILAIVDAVIFYRSYRARITEGDVVFLQTNTLLKRKEEMLNDLLNENTRPEPFKDDDQTTKEKVGRFIEKCETSYMELRKVPLSSGDLEKLKQYLKGSFLTQKEIQDACINLFAILDTQNFYLETTRRDLLNNLARENKDLFNEKPEVIWDSAWYYLPSFDKDKKYVSNETLEKEFNLAISSLQKNKNLNVEKHVNLFAEYKIHLMPKCEYTFSTIKLLLEIARKRPELKEAVYTIKILMNKPLEPDPEGLYTPVIVIYSTDPQVVLDILMQECQPYFSWGSGITPRYNLPSKNGLIFYAQGDFSQKAQLKKEDLKLFNQLYDAQGIHYHPNFGKFPLNLPSNY